MRNQETILEIETMFTEYLQVRALDLVELKHYYEGRGIVFRILVDRPQGGIQLHECASINVEIGRLLDEKNILDEPYILEVSSPGLDRPLKTRKDFERCIGRGALFFLQQPVDGKIEYLGVIKQALEDAVEIESKDGTIRRILYGVLNKAKQVIE